MHCARGMGHNGRSERDFSFPVTCPASAAQAAGGKGTGSRPGALTGAQRVRGRAAGRCPAEPPRHARRGRGGYAAQHLLGACEGPRPGSCPLSPRPPRPGRSPLYAFNFAALPGNGPLYAFDFAALPGNGPLYAFDFAALPGKGPLLCLRLHLKMLKRNWAPARAVAPQAPSISIHMPRGGKPRSGKILKLGSFPRPEMGGKLRDLGRLSAGFERDFAGTCVAKDSAKWQAARERHQDHSITWWGAREPHQKGSISQQGAKE